MNILSRCALIAFSLTLISGCSTPKVVETTKLSDRDLSCESLKDEYKQAEKAKKDAEDVKGVTGLIPWQHFFGSLGLLLLTVMPTKL
jgi:hypothetical protein